MIIRIKETLGFKAVSVPLPDSGQTEENMTVSAGTEQPVAG